MKVIPVTSGTLYDYGLSEFEPSHQVTEEVNDVTIDQSMKQPYQCLPIYLNDDQALDVIKQKAASVDLSGSLFVPNNVDQTNVVWVVFRGYMSWLMDNNMGYTEWRDFAAQNDHVLPINFQVMNRDGLSESDFNNYLAGGYNVCAQSLLNGLKQSFNGDVVLTDQGSRYLEFGFEANTTYNATDSVAQKFNVIDQKIDYTTNGKTAYHQTVTVNTYTDSKLTKVDHEVHECSDITNLIDVFCYNGRVEAYFLPGKPWSTYLVQFGNIFNQMLFQDSFVDHYTDLLNDYLDDAYDYDDDLSQYTDNQKILIDLNDLKHHQYQSHGNFLNWLSNLIYPHCTSNWYQINRLLVLLTVVAWFINLIVGIRVGYFATVISEKLWPFALIAMMAPAFSSIGRYLFLFTKTDASDSLMMARLQFKANFLQWQGAIGLWYVFWNAIGWYLIYISHFVVNGTSWLILWPLCLDWGLWIFPYLVIRKMPKHLQDTYEGLGWLGLLISAVAIFFLGAIPY